MSAPRIYIADPVHAVCADILMNHGFVVDKIKLTKEQLLDNIQVCGIEERFWCPF